MIQAQGQTAHLAKYNQEFYSTEPIRTINPSYVGRHVAYVLTAEFNVDSGPTVMYQYPRSIQGDHQ